MSDVGKGPNDDIIILLIGLAFQKEVTAIENFEN